MSDEQADYQKERAARLRKAERSKIALAVFRDLCLLERRRLDEMRGPDNQLGTDLPVDYRCAATCAVEAADALLDMLDPPEQLLPDYVA